MVRVVKVRLELDRTDYKQGLREAAAEMRTFDGEVKKTGVDMKEAAANTRKYGDDTRRTTSEAINLNKAIADTKQALKELGDEYKKSGNVELQRYRSLTSELRKLERAKRDLDQATGQSGQGLLGGGFLGQGLNAITGFQPTGLVQWLVSAAVAAAPAIGAAINAGVLLGVGSGGLALGIAGAFQDPRVKASWSDFGDFLKSGLADAADSFVGPMEDAAVKVRAILSQVFSSLNLSVLAPSLTRLVDGLGGFATNIMPGLNSALAASAPLLNALADELPQLGSTMSDFFNQIAQGGPGAVSFFKDLMTATEGAITTLGLTTSALSKFYDVFREGTVHDQLEASGLMGWLEPLVADLQKKKKADTDAAQAAADDRVQMTDEAFAAQQAKMSIDQLSSAIDKEVSASLAAKNTHLAFNQSILDLKKSVQENGNTLKDTTEAGIKNSEALLKMAQAAEADRQSVLQQTGSVEQATKVFDDHMNQVYATAAALGLNKQQVDALVGSIRTIPHESSTDIQLKGANVAEDDIRTYKNYLSQIPSNVTTYVNTVHEDTNLGFMGQSYRPAPTGAQRYGGVYEHAAVGKLRDASISSPMAPARYAYAEPQTGGEAFIPKYGNIQRSQAIWSYVGQNWLGMRPAATGGGTQTVVHEHHVTVAYPDGRKIGELLINDAERGGGSAFNTYIRRVASR